VKYEKQKKKRQRNKKEGKKTVDEERRKCGTRTLPLGQILSVLRSTVRLQNRK
jgi:hypothetical protein